MYFEVLDLEHVEIQKAHLELNQKNEEIVNVQETLHTVMWRVYQRILRGSDVPMEEKVKKVDDTISQLQV